MPKFEHLHSSLHRGKKKTEERRRNAQCTIEIVEMSNVVLVINTYVLREFELHIVRHE